MFDAVSTTLVEQFKSGLVAGCHRGTFFEDVGHLTDGPVVQQVLKGTYEYPLDLNPATRLLFEEAAAIYTTLSPTEIATYVTPEDFQQFWQHACKRTGSSYSGLHFGNYIATSFCPDLSFLHAAKLAICTRNGVSLALWGQGLTVLLEKILGNVSVHKLCAICVLNKFARLRTDKFSKICSSKRPRFGTVGFGSIRVLDARAHIYLFKNLYF